MLGVATLIVVNSVMNGFSTKLKDHLHKLMSDIVIETPNYQGFPLDTDLMIQLIQNSSAGDKIQAIAPSIEVFAMINFSLGDDQQVTRAVNLIGIDPVSRTAAGGFAEFLVDKNRQTNPTFELSPSAMHRFLSQSPRLPAKDPSMTTGSSLNLPPPQLDPSLPFVPTLPPPPNPIGNQLPKENQSQIPNDPILSPTLGNKEQKNNTGQNENQTEKIVDQIPEIDPVPERDFKPTGLILGWALGTYRDRNPKTNETEDRYILRPGDRVNIVSVGAGKSHPEPIYSSFVICDYIRTDMAEYDSHMVFVPLDYLQDLRGMKNRVTHILIHLKDYADAREVVNELKSVFRDPYTYHISTWEEKQGALIAAIDVERGILNILLFLIIGVAGFSILAIFTMIVVEKTRDIGILKALGASHSGILCIFLGYGLLLGSVGCILGTVLGLEITTHINQIEHWITQLTGKEVFDRSIYYFSEIPTAISSVMVVIVNIGAILTSVIFSIIPAVRAAMLHPVRALRYE